MLLKSCFCIFYYSGTTTGHLPTVYCCLIIYLVDYESSYVVILTVEIRIVKTDPGPSGLSVEALEHVTAVMFHSPDICKAQTHPHLLSLRFL